MRTAARKLLTDLALSGAAAAVVVLAIGHRWM